MLDGCGSSKKPGFCAEEEGKKKMVGHFNTKKGVSIVKVFFLVNRTTKHTAAAAPDNEQQTPSNEKNSRWIGHSILCYMTVPVAKRREGGIPFFWLLDEYKRYTQEEKNYIYIYMHAWRLT